MSAERQPPAGAPPRCAVCGGATRPVLLARGLTIFECARCPHRQLPPLDDPAAHVRATYGDPYFTSGGGAAAPGCYPNYLADETLRRAHGERYARLIAAAGATTGRVLDVGCAAGFLLSAFAARGFRCSGIEPNAAMAAIARTRYGVEIEAERAEQLDLDQRFDVITAVQVIAHLDAPGELVARAARALVPGGLLLVETWDHRSLPARLLGRRWHEYDPPTVRHWFSRPGLVRLLERDGFDLVRAGRPTKHISWRHARTLLTATLPPVVARPLARLPLAAQRVLPYPALDLFYLLARRRRATPRAPPAPVLSSPRGAPTTPKTGA